MSALLLDLPLPLYLHALPALNRSALIRFGERRGAAAQAEPTMQDRPAAGEPDAQGEPASGPPRLGQRVHDAVLLAGPPDDWQALTGTARPEAAAAVADEPDALRAALAREAFARSPWGPALERGLPELTIVWRDAAVGVWAKARPDLLDPVDSTIWELKTVSRYDRAGAIAFLAQPRNVLQSAMYRAAMRAATGRAWRFGWLMLELDATRRIERHDLPVHLRRQGDWMLRDALAAAAAGPPQAFEPARWRRYALDAERTRRLLEAG